MVQQHFCKHCAKAASAPFKDLNLARKCGRLAGMKHLKTDLLKLQTYSRGGGDSGELQPTFQRVLWISAVGLGCAFFLSAF